MVNSASPELGTWWHQQDEARGTVWLTPVAILPHTGLLGTGV